MALTTFWFILIAILWVGYFVLEGFDFGVGMLLPVLGRDDRERRAIINTIGPVWDGNEVWLITAGGATFAAFPNWYATLFSGFYMPLLLILLTLIVRGVAFEYRHQRPGATWKGWWDRAIIAGSLVPAVLWGVAFANIVRGVPINAQMTFTGNIFTLLNPYGILGGLVTLTLFLTHGAVYLGLKSTGDLRERARALAWKIGLVAAALAVAFMIWTQVIAGNAGTAALFVLAAIGLVGGLVASYRGREGWAFIGTLLAIALAVTALFVSLFPDVMPSSTSAIYSLTTTNASATHYTLKVMTVVACIFTPLVLLYEGWSFWIFRKRVGVQHIPMDELAH